MAEVKNSCFKNSEKVALIEEILSTQDFQIFLHPELSERLPIRLSKTEFIDKNLNIKSNNQKVLIQKDSVEFSEHTVHIKISKIDCKAKSLRYSIFYPIEGAIIKGNTRKSNEGWVVAVSQVGEN